MRVEDAKRKGVQSDEFGKGIAPTCLPTYLPHPYKLLVLTFFLVTLFGCKNDVKVTLKKPNKNTETSTNLSITVSNIQVINHQVVITGTNLTSVSNFEIKEGAVTSGLQIESKTATTLIANTLSHVTFGAGKLLDFIFSNAHAAATFQVNFSLCDSTLGGAGFNCAITPNDKEVLSFDASSNKWIPRSVNGLSYKGAWDAHDPEPVGADSGDYYIVSVANGAYDVGDWIVWNETTSSFDLIDNSQAIVSVAGKTGVVTLNLSDLTDINLTAPSTGQVLRFNGTNWINHTLTYVEADPTVEDFAKTTLPTCNMGQVLSSDGTSFSCVTDNAGAGAFTGTANRAVVTDGSGALTVSSITDAVLGHLSGVTSNIQTQLNSKANSASLINWGSGGLETIDPSRLNLASTDRVVVTNGGGFVTASTVTSTQLGYLSGVTSSIQTQLDSKLGSFTESDPSVSAFAKSALPVCDPGEVLSSDGTVLGCVTDASGAGAYVGALNRLVLTDGVTGALTTSSATNVEAGYLSGVTSSIQTQLNNKQNAGKITTNQQDAGTISPFGTDPGETGEFRFYELVANGSNYTGFKAPDDLVSDIIYTLPQTAPTNGQVLSSTVAGELSWISIPSAPVASVNTQTGAIVLDSDDIGEGSTNLYFTTARAKSATVADAIADTVTDVAPSQNAVFDALALKLNSGSFIEWDQSGLQTIHPSRLNLASTDSVVVTNGGGFVTASTITSTQLGYLSGVTSAIQTQLNSKQGTLGTGSITSTHIFDGTITNDDLAGSIAQGKITNLTTDLAAKQNTSTLASDVRAIVLTGLSTATNAVITAGDSILSAFGKLQAQLNDLNVSVTATNSSVVRRGTAGEVVGTVMKPVTVVSEGANCDSLGLGSIAIDSNGNILTCQN